MIHIFQGNNPQFIEERLEPKLKGDLRVFIWQGATGQLGFDVDDSSEKFVKTILQGANTILFPEIALLEGGQFPTTYLNRFYGVSFWGNEKEVIEAINEYRDYEGQKKKNLLLERYGKKVKNITIPPILKWKEKRRYSAEFLAFCEGKSYVVWDWSDFGTFCYQFPGAISIKKAISNACKSNSTQMHCTSDFNELPFH